MDKQSYFVHSMAYAIAKERNNKIRWLEEMLKFMTDSRNLCCAGGYVLRDFTGRSFRQKIILILFITAVLFSAAAVSTATGQQQSSEMFVSEAESRVAAAAAINGVFAPAEYQDVTTYYLPDGTSSVYAYVFEDADGLPRTAIASATREDVPVVTMWKGLPKHVNSLPDASETIAEMLGVEVTNPTRVIWLNIYDIWFEFAELHPQTNSPIAYNLYSRRITDLESIRDIWERKKSEQFVKRPSDQERLLAIEEYIRSCWQDVDSLINSIPDEKSSTKLELPKQAPPYPYTKYISGVPNFNQGSSPDCGIVAAMDIVLFWDTRGYDRLVDGTDYATVRSDLREAMQYSGGGTTDPDTRDGLRDFCNASKYGNNYSFTVILDDYSPKPYWSDFKTELNANKPVMLGVEGYTNDPGNPTDYSYGDHWVCAVGYYEGRIYGWGSTATKWCIIHDNWEGGSYYNPYYIDDEPYVDWTRATDCIIRSTPGGGGPSCSITVTSPTGSSNWAKGTPHTIMWNSSDNPSSYVKIELYKGSSKVQTITSLTSDDGSYPWTPSLSLADGSDYRIKISSYTDSSCYDYSSYFDLCSCSITVTSPTSRSVWECGNCYYINWDSECNPSNYVKIQLYKGVSLVKTFTTSTSDDGSYYWCVPQDITPGCDYRIKVTSTIYSSCYDYSDYFCITCCSISVTSPDDGCWEVGEVYDINWVSENTSGNVKIDLYKGGAFERIIDPNTDDDGVYDWPIPVDGSLTGDCDYYVKVSDTINSSCYDDSNDFCIATPPQAQDGTVTTSVDTPVTITLQATDEGCPDPPAALTYIIMSLPTYGDLYDPCTGLITDPDPCTPLANNGNQVEYIPDSGYEGEDSFTFIANDDGNAPGGGDSNEATVSINVTACIFFDDFPPPTLDTTNWPETYGSPMVDDTAGYEPSPPYSLHLEDTDSVTSRIIDLYECWSAELHYWWKRVSTESGDDLYLDYWDGNEWQFLYVLPGGADPNWEPNSVELPSDALHEEFRLRFWADCDSTDDEWYIDDVCIQCQWCVEPPVLHAEPNTTQGTCNTIYWDPVADANEYYAECANDVNFTNIDANSGWIANTNSDFCDLSFDQTYWYRVMAWAPFSLKTWLQTTQTDFENDTLTDTRATADGNVVLAGGGGTPVVDTVGGTDTPFTTSNAYFNGFLVTTATTLMQIEVYLGISTSRSIEFVVYEGGASFSNQYNRIHSSTLASSGTGTKFYSSGPISVPLEAAKHYMIGAVWSSSVTTYYDSSDSSPTFADHTGWGSCSVFPSPNILSDVTSAIYTFYHRYTTAQATGGYDSPGSIVSTAIDLPAGGNWEVVDFNTTTPADTELTVDVLNGSDESVILADVNSGTDINSVTATALKLRGNLSTTDTNNTPVLHNWLVTYTDPALACESDWSNDVNSTQCAAPTVTGWEIAATHGNLGELWCPIEDGNGYIEPRVYGISKLCVCFDQAMDTNVTDPNVVSIEGVNNGTQPSPCSITWQDSNCMIIILDPPLPDQGTYTITISSNVKSADGCSFDSASICVTALNGDANRSRAVNAQDLLAIRAHAGEPVDCNNARYDINCSGQINAQDMLAARQYAGNWAPACGGPP